MAHDILLEAKAVITDYDQAVIAELNTDTNPQRLVWVFQPPTSVEKGEWILFQATSCKNKHFKDVRLFPVVSRQVENQPNTPVTLHTLATDANHVVRCSISKKETDIRAGLVTGVDKAIMAKATDNDDHGPAFSILLAGSSIQIHGPPEHLTCPESFCQNILTGFARQRERMPHYKQIDCDRALSTAGGSPKVCFSQEMVTDLLRPIDLPPLVENEDQRTRSDHASAPSTIYHY